MTSACSSWAAAGGSGRWPRPLPWWRRTAGSSRWGWPGTTRGSSVPCWRRARALPRAQSSAGSTTWNRIMAAADVAVENAGGLTAMEAMARGVPVVTYTPIAGHGRANALAMAEAGVAVYAHSPSDLVSCLVEFGRDTPAKRRLVSAARSMFGPDPAELIAAWALSGVVGALVVPVAGSGASQASLAGPPRPPPATDRSTRGPLRAPSAQRRSGPRWPARFSSRPGPLGSPGCAGRLRPSWLRRRTPRRGGPREGA
jgi:hypothetical protein